MVKSEILHWVAGEFAPLPLATPSELLEQQLETAIRYFNTHSAVKNIATIPITTNQVKVSLPLDFKLITHVYPNMQQTNIMQNHPMWSLLGLQVLDNMTSDLISITESLKNYRIYIGNEFKWKFVNSGDVTEPSYILCNNIPVGSTGLTVIGAKRISLDDDITHEHILEWVLEYFRSLVKISEGRLLRVTDIVGIKNDGAALLSEGKEEKKALEDRLAVEGRWLAMSRRF